MMWLGGAIGQLIMEVLLTNLLPIIRFATNDRQSLLLAQGVMATTIFIVSPVGYWYFIEKKPIRHLIAGEQRYMRFLLLTTALILTAMLVNTFFVYWNLQLKFPAWLATFENWAQAKEKALQQLTNLLTTFSSWKDIGMAIIVMGVIPAIGEELVFRGILLPMFAKYISPIHIAIWGSAFIFSAIHLQVYGFVPRLLLGALFGYLYVWTKNLIYPIIAHFLNNSITLLLIFIQQRISYQLLEEQVLPLPLLVTSLFLGSLLLIYLYKQTRYLHHHPPSKLNKL